MTFKTNSLPTPILHVVRDKGTEPPFTGHYDSWDKPGTYLCRQCGLALFRSQTKFVSACGWPSFDEEIPGTVLRLPDADGRRTEILCQRCHGHLGHVFHGEGYTPLSVRHCVNSLSIDFVPHMTVTDTEEAIFGGGCFWGIEHLFRKLPGVLNVEVGYCGGKREHPTYEQVCTGVTGHYESIRVIYNQEDLNYRDLAKYFFEIHDPTQADGQGPDVGDQYLSVAFYYDEKQKKTLVELVDILSLGGLQVATKILPVSPFWRAEENHQDYYGKSHQQPCCHRYEKRFP
jgi:peptide methionine sulfoxide reductase msrA/msrB